VAVVVSSEQVGIFHALAEPFAADGVNMTGCTITILPNAQKLSGKNLIAVLAHEVWHCFEYSRLGTMSRRNTAPPWILEGQAMWVGEAFVGGSDNLEPTVRHWKEYLLDPGLAVGLFKRSYDAIGFYSHLHDEGIDPWTILDPILDATSNLAAFNAAVGSRALEVVTSWAPGWYRDSQPTSTFALINAPGILPVTVRPVPGSFTISDGTFNQVAALKPLSAGIADVDVAAEILTIDVIGQAVVGDMVFGDEIVIQSGSHTFCIRGDCTCPEGSVRATPTENLGDELRVAVTGDALSGADAQLRGWSREEWCEDTEAFPSEPGTPCQDGCGSSNGDPHLTTVDGLSYDFQAAGEFTLLRSGDGDLEVQARQEPYQDSKAVTINTGVAVAAGDGRAAVYASRSGLTLFVDGVQAPIDEPITTGALQIRPVPDGIEMRTGGTTVWALGIGEWGLNILVAPSPELRGDGVGLLGAVGDGDLPRLPDGGSVDVSGDYRTTLYVDFAEAWAVTQATTLFDYEDGFGPDSFRDRTIPEPGAPFDFADLAAALQQLGLEACADIGGELLQVQCAFDFAMTEDSGFIDTYESTDDFLVTTTTLGGGGGGAGAECVPLEICDIEVEWTQVPLPDHFPEEIVVDGSTAYVTTDEGTVLEVDLASGSIVNTYQFDDEAVDVAVNGNDLWVLTTSGPVRVDRSTGESGPVFDSGSSNFHIVATDDAVWVTTNGTGEVVRLDPATGAPVATITDYDNIVGGDPPRITAAFGSVWVIDKLGGRLLQIAPGTNSIVAVFDQLGFEKEDLGGGSFSVLAAGPQAVTATEDAVWVISDLINPEQVNVVGAAGVFRIDPTTGSVEQVLELIADADQTSFVVGSDAVWYLDFVNDYLIRADLTTGQQARFRFQGSGRGVALSDGMVWVTVEGFGDPSGVYGIEETAAAAAISE
jgi:hypothetical protein